MDRTKKIIMALILGLIVAGVLIYGLLFREKSQVAPAEQITPPTTNTPPDPSLTPAPAVLTPDENALLNAEIDAVYEVDKDFDGISDKDEALYGTSPESSDTDNDGLLDKTEVTLYKTDPLNHDTDTDGFDDGYEVSRGFNPKGGGRLTP